MNSFQSPVAGEPSLGTPHTTSDANRTATLVVDTSTNTAGVWSAAVTMTGVPVGAKAAWCEVWSYATGAWGFIAVEAASGYTLSNITTGTNIFKYYAQGAQANTTPLYIPMRIPLDSNGQFKWCPWTTNQNVKIGSAICYEE
jgi:hypothetical protein